MVASDSVWPSVWVVVGRDAGVEDWARPEGFHPTGVGGG